jgi:hypothetical protein
MSTASFKVRGKLDSAGAEQEGTVTIDRETGKVTVRPKGRRTTYETTLGRIATWVCQNGFANKPTTGGDEE